MTGKYLQSHFLIVKPVNMILSLFCKISQVGHKAAENSEKKKKYATSTSTDCFELDG